MVLFEKKRYFMFKQSGNEASNWEEVEEILKQA